MKQDVKRVIFVIFDKKQVVKHIFGVVGKQNWDFLCNR